MSVHMRKGSAWVEASEIFAKVFGAWKTVSKGYHKADGVWKLVYQMSFVLSSKTHGDLKAYTHAELRNYTHGE